MRSINRTLTKQTMGRVRRRVSMKQRRSSLTTAGQISRRWQQIDRAAASV